MFVEDPNDLDETERMIKFHEIAREYGRAIAAWETAPWVTEYELLQRDGVQLRNPDDMDDDELTDLLWKIIESMATRNTFFYQTDHLSEREFYERLYYEVLHEPAKDYAAVLDPEELTGPGAWVQTIDMCDDGDLETYWRYYADDETRERHAEQFPDMTMPPREEPPYDRDRFLPRSYEDAMMERGEFPEYEEEVDEFEIGEDEWDIPW
mgnify:CR=1 FL=1